MNTRAKKNPNNTNKTKTKPSSTPARRLNPSAVASSAFLNNRLVEVAAFMENIAVKDGSEKDAFFKRLPGLVPSIPGPVATRKLLPQLSRALEFGGAPASALGSLLLIGKALPADEFERRVVPTLSKLFASTDRALRRQLLEAVEGYAPALSAAVVEDQIYPPLQAGFSDDNAYIRELTLKAALVLAPKMKQATLTQNLLKHLSRLQVCVC
jgi:SCY1-like protein 1